MVIRGLVANQLARIRGVGSNPTLSAKKIIRGESMKINKNGFIDLGNGFLLNPNQVVSIDEQYIICKHGEKFHYGELPNNDKHDYLDNLYDTNRKD